MQIPWRWLYWMDWSMQTVDTMDMAFSRLFLCWIVTSGWSKTQPFHVNRALSMKWWSNASGYVAINMYSLWTLWLTALLGKAKNARIKKRQEEKQDMNDGNIPSHISCCFSNSCQTCSFIIFNSSEALLVHVFVALTYTGAVLHSRTCIMDVLPSFQWHSGSFEECSEWLWGVQWVTLRVCRIHLECPNCTAQAGRWWVWFFWGEIWNLRASVLSMFLFMAAAAPRALCILCVVPLEEKTIFWMCTVPCSDADMVGCSFLNPFLRLNSDPGKSLVLVANRGAYKTRCVGVSALVRDDQLISIVCVQALNGRFTLAALALFCGVGS